MQIAQALDELTQHPDFQLLRRVPTTIKEKKLTGDRIFTASIIDLETMDNGLYDDHSTIYYQAKINGSKAHQIGRNT